MIGLGLFATMSLIAMGEYCRRFVGFIYYNPDSDLVRFAYCSWSGRRIDVTYDRSEVIPLSESGESDKNLIWRIHFYDDRRQSWLLVTSDPRSVLDRKLFDRVFQ